MRLHGILSQKLTHSLSNPDDHAIASLVRALVTYLIIHIFLQSWTELNWNAEVDKIVYRYLLQFSAIYQCSIMKTIGCLCLNHTQIVLTHPGKVHIFWEGHKILRNLSLTFVYSTYRQKKGGNFAKFSGLLRICELLQDSTVYVPNNSYDLRANFGS